MADSLPLPLLVEGIDERESEKMDVDHAELRITGPFINEVSRDFFELHITTNILLTDLMGGEGENTYSLFEWAGAFQEAACKPISVYRYGRDTLGIDDGSRLGCLLPFGKDGSRLFHYGQVSTKDRVRQSAIDTRHYMQISNP